MDWWWADEFQRLFMAAVRLAHCLGDYLGDWMVRKVSDKERLEEVVENVVFLRGLTGSLNAELPEDDFWYLYEQAERVQELEKEKERYQSGRNIAVKIKMRMDDLEKQNKRYREALEFYANRENYEPEHYDPDTHDYTSMIDRDKGATARKALEG